jgi:ribosomal protein L37AE/L43A
LFLVKTFKHEGHEGHEGSQERFIKKHPKKGALAMNEKHKVFRRSDGAWSCQVCKWIFQTYPGKKNCPGVLRIEHMTKDYKTEKQWLDLGYKTVAQPGHFFPTTDAVSIVHSTCVYRYYHRDNVKIVE